MITKFRAWDKKDKDIKEVTSIDWSLDIVEFLNGAIEREFDSVTIMQSTGLKDNNGVEIYEGDIVKYDHPFYPYRIIVFHMGAWQMKIHEINSNIQEIYNLCDEIEVIGNIWENAELLEVAE